MVTILANYVPLQAPAGGPNFFEFGDDVLYKILIDNDGDTIPNIVYEFRFTTTITNPKTFLYNTGPILSLTDPNWNRRQTYKVRRIDVDNGKFRVTELGSYPCPPCNIGPLSTPDYNKLAKSAIGTLPKGAGTVFAGQRAEGFYVDLGSIFDLGNLRPVQNLHNLFGLAIPELTKPAPGVNATKDVNVHSIALKIPKKLLTKDGSDPTDPASAVSVIGVYTSASRQKIKFHEPDGRITRSGPWQQVSRLGNPLVNEVLVPMSQKDRWNTQFPDGDKQFLDGTLHPELAGLLPVLYPNVFPRLDALNKSGKDRADLAAALMTGIPAGLIAGFQNASKPGTVADLLRLNMAIPPSSKPSNLGLVGGDPAGFPNGRRVFDDVVTIELRAIAGVIYPLVDPAFKPDDAVAVVGDGNAADAADLTARGTENYLQVFPYLGVPKSGYAVPAA
jgi:hypothetical protein